MKKIIKGNIVLLLLISFLIVLSSCKKEKETQPKSPDGVVTDIDGNKYTTVKIGAQTWLVENLRTTRYNDGTPIPYIKNDGFVFMDGEAYSFISDEEEKIYGKIYSWYAVNTGKLCPKGWHIPSEAEWTQLKNYLGAEKAGQKMKAIGNRTDGTGLWMKNINGKTEGTNESGFTALPGGYLFSNGGIIGYGSTGVWWSATEIDAHGAATRLLESSSNEMLGGGLPHNKNLAVSCRCLQDK